MVTQDDGNKRQGLRVRKFAGESGVIHTDHATGEPSKHPLAGVGFTDDQGRNADLEGNPIPAPKRLRLPSDYVMREPWIEIVNPRPVLKPSGPPSNPWGGQQGPHNFVHIDEFVLHMVDGDYRYRVVHQPDKYDTPEHVDGAVETPCDTPGDPTTHVDWFYDADLIEGD